MTRQPRVWQKKLGIQCPVCGGVTRVSKVDTQPGMVRRYRVCEEPDCDGKTQSIEVAGKMIINPKSISGIVLLDKTPESLD